MASTTSASSTSRSTAGSLYTIGALPVTSQLSVVRCSTPYLWTTGSVVAEFGHTYVPNNVGAISSCWPQGYNDGAVYSPGICPSGWAPAAAPDPRDSVVWNGQTVGTSERLARCCPSFPGTTFQLSGTIGGTRRCYTIYPTTNVGSLTGQDYFCSTTTGCSTLTYPASGVVWWASIVNIAYQATDTAAVQYFKDSTFPSSTSRSSISSASSASSASSGSSSSTASSTTSTSPQPESQGLSSTTKVAIGVAVPLVVIIAVLSGVLFFMFRKKRRSKAAANNTGAAGNMAQPVPTSHEYPVYGHDSKPSQVQELSDGRQYQMSHELPHESQPFMGYQSGPLETYELSGSEPIRTGRPR